LIGARVGGISLCDLGGLLQLTPLDQNVDEDGGDVPRGEAHRRARVRLR
jgi:hypothetical protein